PHAEECRRRSASPLRDRSASQSSRRRAVANHSVIADPEILEIPELNSFRKDMTMNRNHFIGAAVVTAAALILGRAWTVVHAQTAPRAEVTATTSSAVPVPKNVIVYQDGNALIHSVVPVTNGNQYYAYGVAPAEDDPEMGELAQVESQASQ